MLTSPSKPLKRGFTLLELLIVIALLAFLAVVVVIVLNPAETLSKARDAQRLSDLSTLKSAIALYLTDVTSPDLDGTGSSVCQSNGSGGPYASWGGNGDTGSGNITDTTITTPSSGVVTANQDSTAVDGTGWVPVNLTAISGGTPISNLPLDPNFSVNNPAAVAASDRFYLYGCNTSMQFELNANLESTTNAARETGDGGNDDALFEIGSLLTVLDFAP